MMAIKQTHPLHTHTHTPSLTPPRAWPPQPSCRRSQTCLRRLLQSVQAPCRASSRRQMVMFWPLGSQSGLHAKGQRGLLIRPLTLHGCEPHLKEHLWSCRKKRTLALATACWQWSLCGSLFNIKPLIHFLLCLDKQDAIHPLCSAVHGCSVLSPSLLSP